MPYTLNYAGGTITVNDGTLNTSTTLQLPGRNYSGYGSPVDQNLVSLLESFAYYSASPPNPITGQIWYDTVNSLLKVYDGSAFVQISGAEVSATAPSSPAAGALWYDTVNTVLKVYDGASWISNSPPAGLQSASAVAITGGTISGVTLSSLGSALAIADGGTGATTDSGARTNLGLGTMAVVNSPVPIANGGTGATNAGAARTALGLGTMSVVNSPAPVGDGGTGQTTLTLNNVLLGNGTGPVQAVAPGASGNALVSNGTTWTSSALSTAVPTAYAAASVTAVGSIVMAEYTGAFDDPPFLITGSSTGKTFNHGDTTAGSNLTISVYNTYGLANPVLGSITTTTLPGTWRLLGSMYMCTDFMGTYYLGSIGLSPAGIWQRVA